MDIWTGDYQVTSPPTVAGMIVILAGIWGQTTVIDEFCTEDYSDCYWIHACEGHVNYYDGGDYIPSHLPEDQGVEPQEI